jgi:hypothetical protein
MYRRLLSCAERHIVSHLPAGILLISTTIIFIVSPISVLYNGLCKLLTWVSALISTVGRRIFSLYKNIKLGFRYYIVYFGAQRGTYLTPNRWARTEYKWSEEKVFDNNDDEWYWCLIPNIRYVLTDVRCCWTFSIPERDDVNHVYQ